MQRRPLAHHTKARIIAALLDRYTSTKSSRTAERIRQHVLELGETVASETHTARIAGDQVEIVLTTRKEKAV